MAACWVRMLRVALVMAFMPAIVRAEAEPITFNQHIAPIVWKNCTGCHRPGEVGPFSLVNYQDVAKRAEFVAELTSSRRMPPWKAEPGFGKFHDARVLSDSEIALIKQWADGGAIEGAAKDLPPAPTFPEGWQLGEPDLVLKMPTAFTVPASGNDIYRCFVLPIPIDADRTVAAVEFRPGNRRVVHHAIFFLDAMGSARKRDGEDGQPGYASFGGPGILPTGGLGGWAPGAMPRKLPEGTGKFVRKGSDLVMQVHYHSSGKAEQDQSTVGIYFTKQPAEKIVVGVAVRTRKLDIPAGARRHEVSAESAPLPCDVQAIAVSPHMHNLGREIKVTSTAPDGTITPLVWIKDWDFNWQGSYLYAEPVKLVKGSIVKIEAAYDNSSENPRNPNSPPRDVHWGEQTNDEMCLASVAVVTETRSDLRQIARMRGNWLGVALDGGIAPEEADADADDRFAQIMPAAGFPIPEKHKAALSYFDKNADGRIDAAEVAAMPAPIRTRVRDAVLQKVGQ